MRALAFALLAVAFAQPVAAQDTGEDWDLTVNPEQLLTLASLDYGDNALALRCRAGNLEVLLTGVPATAAESRAVQVTAGLISNERQNWRTQAGLPVLSASEPDRLARQMRAGGVLDVRIDGVGTGDRARRYQLPIPASARSVDQVLAACDRPLSDDWDGLSRDTVSLLWADAPAADFPTAALQTGVEAGTVVIQCIVETGGELDVCRVISESPKGAGFGSEAMKAAMAARVQLAPNDTASSGRVVQFTQRFSTP